MTKLNEVLKKWEENMWLCPLSIRELLNDIRTALKDCSVIEWHPASEKPKAEGRYLCRLRRSTIKGLAFPDDGYKFVEYVIYPQSGSKWHTAHTVVEWAHLPERKGE